MYEHRTAPVLPWPAFLRRMTRQGVLVIGAAIASIGIGMLLFHFFAEESWLDAYLNATMLLGGMGPIGEIRSPLGKFFAGLFALYAGLFFIGAFALLPAPVIH